MAVPFDQIPIGEGLDPEGNPGAMVYVDRGEIDRLEEEGPQWQLEDARFIPEAVSSPDATFEVQKDRYCYSVRPTRDPDDEHAQMPPRFGYAFLVFVRPAVWGYVVDDWSWREEDFDNPGHPAGWKSDFARRIWNKT
jgi:hypothetical protein